MTAHTHAKRVDGCYRCELGRDEAESAMQFEIADLEAERELLTEHVATLAGVLNALNEGTSPRPSMSLRRSLVEQSLHLTERT